MRIINVVVTAISLLVLAGCTATGSNAVRVGSPVSAETAGPAPTQPQTKVAASARLYFVDPNSLQDVELSELFTVNSYGNPARGLRVAPHWVMCMKANARNRMGGYVGLKYYAFVFEGGAIVDVSDVGAAYGCLDSSRRYSSFSV